MHLMRKDYAWNNGKNSLKYAVCELPCRCFDTFLKTINCYCMIPKTRADKFSKQLHLSASVLLTKGLKCLFSFEVFPRAM